MTDKKVLDKFCKRLVALDMDIFGTRKHAMDAEPKEGEEHWITMNGAHILVEGGETNEEAGKRFIAEKSAKKETTKAATAKKSPKLNSLYKEGKAILSQPPSAENKKAISDQLEKVATQLQKMSEKSPEYADLKVHFYELKDHFDKAHEAQKQKQNTSARKDAVSKAKELTSPKPLAGNKWDNTESLKNDIKSAGFSVTNLTDGHATIEDRYGDEYNLYLTKDKNGVTVNRVSNKIPNTNVNSKLDWFDNNYEPPSSAI